MSPESGPRDEPRAAFSRWAAALVLLLLVATRLLFIPGVPWTPDEARFGAASFDTDMSQGRPHSPGFPLWIALGKAGLFVAGAPVAVLQLISALASVLTVVLLVLLWSRALGNRSLGTAAGLLFAFAPAVLLFAPRALTTTPALGLAVVAAALWVRPGRLALAGGAVAMGCALLVRPTLAPPVLVACLAAMVLRRERPAGIALAGTLFATTMGLGLAPLVWDSGGLEAYLALVLGQVSGHGGALGHVAWDASELGLVKAVGGIVPALAALALSVVGWARLCRERPRLAWWWLAVTLTTAGWLLLAHNRTLPRYAPLLPALLAGPVVHGCWTALRSKRLVLSVAALAATAGLAWTAPALIAQATQDFPPLVALEQAQSAPGRGAVIVDGALSPFADFLVLARRTRRPMFWRPLLAEGRVDWAGVRGPWTYVWSDGAESAWIRGPGHPGRVYSCSGDRLGLLLGTRYLQTRTAERGGIVISPASPRRDDDGSVWIDGELELLLQPAPRGSWLGAVLEVAEATEVELSGGRQGTLRNHLEPGVQPAHVQLDRLGREARRRPVLVTLSSRDSGRVRVRSIWIDAPDGRFTPPRMAPEDQANGMDGLVDSEGFYGVERLGPDVSGRWTGPQARLSVPAGKGCLAVTLCSSRPETAQVTLASRELRWDHALEVGTPWTEVRIPTSGHGRLILEIDVANPFIPAQTIPGSQDRRELGVFVGELRFLAGCD